MSLKISLTDIAYRSELGEGELMDELKETS